MGSFNTTCFASQQTIIPGAKCVIIPIAQQATFNPVPIEKNGEQFAPWGIANSTCYPSCFWGHSGQIIRGTYYDYGRFELDETIENTMALVSLFQELLENSYVTKQGKNEYHDIPFNMQELYNPQELYSFEELLEIWEKIWDVTQEHRLFINDYHKSPRQFQFAVMHEKTAQYLIDKVSSFSSYGGQSYEQKSYFKDYVQSKLSRVIDFFNKKEARNPKEAFSFFSMQISSLDNYRIGDQEGTYLSIHYNHYEAVENIIDKFVTNNTDLTQVSNQIIDELFNVFKPQLDHRYIHAGLDHLNIKLTPMVYAGQDYSNDIGNAYLEMIQSVNQSINDEIKEKYGDDDYDEDDE